MVGITLFWRSTFKVFFIVIQYTCCIVIGWSVFTIPSQKAQTTRYEIKNIFMLDTPYSIIIYIVYYYDVYEYDCTAHIYIVYRDLCLFYSTGRDEIVYKMSSDGLLYYTDSSINYHCDKCFK